MTEDKGKKGIIYLSSIPPGMNVKIIREMFSKYGEIGRIYLEKHKTKNKYIEGWIEFKKKKVAKRVAEFLNGQQVKGKRKNIFYESLWSIKYLHRFKWNNLVEQMNHEKAIRQQKIRFELEQAKKQTAFYTEMIEKSRKRKTNEFDPEKDGKRLEYIKNKQYICDEKVTKSKHESVDGVEIDVLKSIFAKS